MISLRRHIFNNIAVIALLLISIILVFKNYTPNTFLSGWDTLHPEFNFGLNISREINGVFRTEQGLGAVAAHSHMADLPRVFILYFIHFILPLSGLRYFYIFLNLVLGPVGMYFFLKKYIVKNKIWSFLGSLFYLLNLGTMQTFIVPFEMFTTQYALLPWLFLFATEYLLTKEESIKKLLFFSIATLFIAPSAYAATLWYVYFFVLILYIFSLSFLEQSLLIFKKSLVLVASTLLINAFWILPNIYYILNHASQVPNALINQLFSSQAFLYNKEFGNIKDIALLKNFLFDWNVYSGNNHFSLLLSPWIAYLNHKYIQLIGYIFALVSLSGVFYGASKKNKILASLTLPLLMCLFFLINDNPPTSFLYNFLQNKIPLFKEVFRFPDDKVLGIFTFLFAIYFAKGQEFIQKLINIASNLNTKMVKELVHFILFFLLILIYMFPAFKGNFVSPYMRVNIPKSYFEMFKWFNEQKNGKVAVLPINSFWGWSYYNWYDDNKPSFQGAGFLQFGIKQPLLDRDFDRWSPYNEQYYREMSYAIYNRNSTLLDSVIKKYDIKYILLDKNIISPQDDPKVLFFNEIQTLLAKSLHIAKVFQSGNVLVYQTNNQDQAVRIIKNPIPVGPKSSVLYNDFVYSKYTDYITYPDQKKNIIFYPNRNIIDNQNRLYTGFILPNSVLENQNRNPKAITDIAQSTDNSCAPDIQNKPQKDILIGFVRYTSQEGSFCDRYSYPTLSRNQGYLISITSRNLQGLPLKLCILNYLSGHCDLSAQLSSFPTFKKDTFLLPPMDEGVGFDVNLNNFGVKKTPSINELKSIEIAPFPYIQSSQIETYSPASESLKEKSVLIFAETFEKGWKAYKVKNTSWLTNIFPFLFGKELKEQVLVSNWANGWILDNSDNNSKFTIIFWPQYLEYLGIMLLIGSFMWLGFSFKRR